MGEFFGFFVITLARVLMIALFVRVMLSWFNIDQSSPFYPIVNIAHQITEPMLAPIRQMLTPLQQSVSMLRMLDLSPIVAFILIRAVTSLLT